MKQPEGDYPFDGIIQIDSDLPAKMVIMDATSWNHLGNWKRGKKAPLEREEGKGMKIER